MDDISGKLHEAIYEEVARAVPMVAHLEAGDDHEWGEAEITKRVVRYIVKACIDPELLDYLGNWRHLAQAVVQRSMHGYSAACGDTEWFFQIDLAPTFARVVWEMVSASGRHVPPQAIHEAVELDYQDQVERRMLDKAMWEMGKAFFDGDDKVQSKLFRALSGSYWSAVDSAIQQTPRNEVEDLEVVKDFLRSWMQDGIGRAWHSLPAADAQAESVLTVDVVSQLFQGLVVPFGDEHPFTCIPGVLLDRIGRPPSSWDVVQTLAEEVVNFCLTGEAPASQQWKKRKTGGAGGWGGGGGGGWELSGGGGSWPKKKGGAPGNAEGGGNPACTSATDCAGFATDRLVQHVLHGQAADVYCETCWISFSARNPTLEGVYLDEA